MNVSLEQAIEIHANVLHYRKGGRAGAAQAVEEAERCKARGDQDGFEIWLKVREAVVKAAARGGDRRH